jgi:predicted outer membrane repeat protein
MSLQAWLQSWKRRWQNKGTRLAGRPRRRPAWKRLSLECLEDRLAPALLMVTSALDTHQDGLVTLREAVSLANADASSGQSDLIAFDEALGNATVTLTAGKLELSGASASATLTIDGAGRITLSGNHAHRIFQVDAGVHAELDGLSITDGTETNSFGISDGGGIYNSGTLTVSASTLSGNSAGNSGGGIYNAGTLTVSDSAFTGNSAGYGGGGISNDNNTTVSNSTFAANSAPLGASIDNEFGTLTVDNSAFTANHATADGGGGIYTYDGSVTVSASTFTDNSAGYGGGGIYNFNSTLTVSNSTFAGNSVHNIPGGGGIFSYTGVMTLSNTTFTGNSAPDGGGIYNAGRATLSNSIVTGNSATFSSGGAGGGILNDSYPLTLTNSIVAGNSAGFGPDLNGQVDSGSSYNLIGDGSRLTGIRAGVNHNQIGTSASPIDPKLSPLADHGGPTQTFALLSGSPALGAGGPSTTLTSSVVDTATSLSVALAAGLAVNAGLTIQIDAEQLLITGVNIVNNTFTVVRGVNGTSAADHDAGAGLFPATDQRGAPRLVNGNLDIGPYQTQPASRLELSISGSISAGVPFTLTVTAYDAYGNVAIGYAGTVTFASSDPDSQMPADYVFGIDDAGTHNFTITLYASAVTLFISDPANNLSCSLDVLVS